MIQSRYGWHDEYIAQMKVERFFELQDIIAEVKHIEWLDTWQREAFNAWAILSSGMGLKITYKKFLTNFGLMQKAEPKTPEQKAQETQIALSKAAKIVNFDPYRFERMRKRREGIE